MGLAKLCTLCFFLLLVSLLGFGVSYKPEDYLSKETHFLEQGEVPEKVIEIGYGDKEFYVVQITLNEKVNGYIALKKFVKEVIENEVTSKLLFQTAEFIQEYQEFKKEVKENPALVWFIVKWGEASTISNKLANEGLELDLIRKTLDNPSGNEIISKMEALLETIRISVDVLKEKMSSTYQKENSFLRNPIVGGEKELKEALLECYSFLESLHSLNQDYETLQQQLAIVIAEDPDLSMETKQQLNKTADLPQEFTEIKNWHRSSQNMQLKETIESIYFNSSTAASNYAKAIKKRVKRNLAFNALYSEDSELKTKTNNEYSSLKGAFDGMSSEKVRDLWKEQERLSEFLNEWANAEAKFNLGDYDRALEWAGKAKKDAIAVFEAGLIEQDGTQIDYGMLINGVVLIIILIAILYAIRNREKLKSFISGSEEEVVFNELE